MVVSGYPAEADCISSRLLCFDGVARRRDFDLTERQWERAQKFLTGNKGDKGRTAKLNRIFWIIRTGAPWRDLHEDFGNWNNVYQTFRRWSERQVFLLLLLSLVKQLNLRVLLVDGTFVKVHQHATGAPKGDGHPTNLGRRKPLELVEVA